MLSFPPTHTGLSESNTINILQCQILRDLRPEEGKPRFDQRPPGVLPKLLDLRVAAREVLPCEPFGPNTRQCVFLGSIPRSTSRRFIAARGISGNLVFAGDKYPDPSEPPYDSPSATLAQPSAGQSRGPHSGGESATLTVVPSDWLEIGKIPVRPRSAVHRSCETISSSAGIHSPALALGVTAFDWWGDVFGDHANGSERRTTNRGIYDVFPQSASIRILSLRIG